MVISDARHIYIYIYIYVCMYIYIYLYLYICKYLYILYHPNITNVLTKQYLALCSLSVIQA